MKHWFIDDTAEGLPSWREAMPQAAFVGRAALGQLPKNEEAVFWVRLRAGRPLESCLPVEHGPAQFVVLLCDEPEEGLVVQALATGAAGCCNTHAAPEVLRQVALVVGNGGLWVGQSLLQKLIGATNRALEQRLPAPNDDSWAAGLSDRETQVARLVANGASNKEIARDLDITERTVKAHLTTIFEKLGLRDRLQLSLRVNGVQV